MENLKQYVMDIVEPYAVDFMHGCITQKIVEKLDIENISYVLEEDVGGEGQGDDYYSVYSFSHGDEKVYIKFDGYYSSSYGSEFEEMFEVYPEVVEIVVYNRRLAST